MESDGPSRRGSSGRSATATALAFAILGCGQALIYFFFVAPNRSFEIFRPFEDYPVAPMQEAMRVQRVAEVHDTIVRLGSRFMGQPGFRRAADTMRTAFERAGLEIYEQKVSAVVPQTAYREIYRVSAVEGAGRPHQEQLEDVEVYPFMPNQMQPVVTPGEGITGKLILLDEETLSRRTHFDDCIGLIDSREGGYSQEHGFDWINYAALGVKALIVSHSEGLEEAPWYELVPHRGLFRMVSSQPINYVRLAATREIFDHVGETIRLRVRVDYKRVRSVSLFGILRAPEPAAEALIVSAPYGTPSFLPDLAPGVLPALAPAVQLQLLKGILAYRSTLRRDVIFAAFSADAIAAEGHNRIVQVIRKNEGLRPQRPLELGLFDPEVDGIAGTLMDESDPRQTWLAERWEENERQRHRVNTILHLFADEGFATDPQSTESILDELEPKSRKSADEQFTYVVKTLGFELSEPLMRAKVGLERELAGQDVDSPAFRRFYEAKRRYEEATAASGYGMVNLLRNKPEFAAQYRLRARFRERMEELRRHHDERRLELEQDVRLLNLLSSYERIGIFSTRLATAPPDAESETEVVSANVGYGILDTTTSKEKIIQLMSWADNRLGLGDGLEVPIRTTWRAGVGGGVNPHGSEIWASSGYPTYFIYNFERNSTYKVYSHPFDRPFMRNLDSLENTFAVVGESVLSLAHGNLNFEPTKIIPPYHGKTYSGRVLAANVGQSIVPDYPVKNALVACRSRPEQNMWASAGYYSHPILMTDVYGRYDAAHNFNDFPILWNVFREGGGVSPVAVRIGEDGLISHIKNEGDTAQRVFKSVKIPYERAEDLTLVLFRAAPVTLLDLSNPQTLNQYTGVEMIQREGLVPVERLCAFQDRRMVTTFLEPDRRYYVKLQSGAAENELVKVTRAFSTNVDDTQEENLEKEIDGIGYLAANHPFLLDIASETAHSMAYVNGRRLDLQNRYGMADERTNAYHAKVLSGLRKSKSPELSKSAAIMEAREAVTYATLNHPVLRESIFEAVVGIIWYLALVVPFIFFFEKLVFCISDVRRQLAVQFLIFIVVFSLLRLLHPAFQMVRSSLMIFLGFIIILISTAITILFSSKFQENLEELRKRKGKVAAAEINKLGVMATAFMLGLNNLHRRRVRTGLTCMNLTLLTFVIICFTSVQNDLVVENRAVGKAPYTGMLIKKELMAGFGEDEIKAIQEKFGDRYTVCPRGMGTGREDWATGRRSYSDLKIYRYDKGGTLKADADAIVSFKHNEPMRHQIRFLTDNGWFDEIDEYTAHGHSPVFLPESIAARLNITVNDVEKGDIELWVNGWKVVVRGIFEAKSYNAMTDLDGYRMLPFDVMAIDTLINKGWGSGVLASEDDPKIPAERIVMAPYWDNRNLLGRTLSVAVSMPEAEYKEAQEVIENTMEQTARPLSYGIEGVAFRGRRTREVSLAGWIDLLIPLLIAAVTVLNTMRGSVYERRDEIYVYNSVGIAPRYVFFIFIAEAAVYAVVGSVLGYIFSQGIGRVLTILGMTGGLNMTFTSLTTVYASLAIFAAVLLSTWFPAKSAMQIAAPAEETGWDLPEPEGNCLHFDLPFSFRSRERLEVLAFFDRWFRNHGEGGAGRFSTSIPDVGLVNDPSPDEYSTYIPYISVAVWLKPFDLGVSQQLTITMPPDPATGEFRAQVTLEHLTGTRESWLRLNQGFIAQIRRHFLHWRAVSPTEREELFAEIKDLLGI